MIRNEKGIAKKKKALELLKDEKNIDLLPYVPQIADEIVVNAEKRYNLIAVFNDLFPDAMSPSVFLTLGTIARLKNFHSMAYFPLTTNPFLLERLSFAVHTGKGGLFNEKNVRNGLYSDSTSILCSNANEGSDEIVQELR